MRTKAIKPRSPKQQAVLDFGKAIRALSNSYCLARYLRKNGWTNAAWQVEKAMQIAKDVALENYKKQRKAIDPNWEPKELELGYSPNTCYRRNK